MDQNKPGLLWIAAQHQKNDLTWSHEHTLTLLTKNAYPYVMQVEDPIPSEFGAWRGRYADFKFEKYQDKDLNAKLRAAWQSGLPVSLKKGNNWFLVWSRPAVQGDVQHTAITIEPTDESTGMSVPHLPDNWEEFVEVSAEIVEQ